jgi:hypothetical protein
LYDRGPISVACSGAGAGEATITMSDDFDEPLEDFVDYR